MLLDHVAATEIHGQTGEPDQREHRDADVSEGGPALAVATMHRHVVLGSNSSPRGG